MGLFKKTTGFLWVCTRVSEPWIQVSGRRLLAPLGYVTGISKTRKCKNVARKWQTYLCSSSSSSSKYGTIFGSSSSV